MKSIRTELERIAIDQDGDGTNCSPSNLTKAIRWLFERYARMLLKLYCPLTVVGRKRLPKTPFVFCSNHNSHMDSAVLMIAAQKGFDSFGMMAARDYFFENSIRRFFMTLFMNLVPVERKRNDRKSLIEGLAACREFMKDGRHCLIIYPEGTRSRTGKIAPFKKGPAMIATELGVPVVPAYIDGTQDAWPKGSRFIRPKQITCCIGEPIQPEPDVEADGSDLLAGSFQTYRRITAQLEQGVRDLAAQLQREQGNPVDEKQRVG